ncbi:ABC transporter ATP-binding protein, partial [Candidatus Kapabacteria bacterium]|nr:ABC transporter ATP-binding protein [Candidatus Kapabacteria bacterium]
VSTEKLTTILDYPTETYVEGSSFPKSDYSIFINNVVIVDKVFGSELVAKNLKINKNEKICISGDSNRTLNDFIDILSGMKENFTGSIKFNETNIKNISRLEYHDKIATLNKNDEIFRGSLYDNLSMNRSIPKDKIDEMVNEFELQNFVESCPKGLEQKMYPGGKNLNTSVLNKLLIARALLKNSELIVANDFFSRFEPIEKRNLINQLMKKSKTLIIASNDPEIALNCDRLFKYRNGQIIEILDFKSKINESSFGELIK